MESLTRRDKQTVRFLKWTRRYSGWWFLICTPGDEHMNLDMMKNAYLTAYKRAVL